MGRNSRVMACLLILGLAASCSRRDPPAQERLAADAPSVSQSSARPIPLEGSATSASGVGPEVTTPAILATSYDLPPVPLPEASTQDRYDAALLDALRLLADRKFPEALAMLESARRAQDTEPVRQEIARVAALVEQQAAAQRTVDSIRTVIDRGKPEEASRLAAAALDQFGGSDQAPRLTALKREADALVAADLDKGARRARFRQEGEIDLRDQNLRAAALAYEQALQETDDPQLRQQLNEIRSTLTRYDDSRRRAAELRRDPANLEDAVAALQEAAKAWDTPSVRQEIDEYTMALSKRRDRIAVADFEVRGDVGLPEAGRTVAEELLPRFRSRFDLVERGQLGRVVDELRLASGSLSGSPDGQQEMGRLLRARYLVIGSLTPLGGVTAYARLVDLRSGLVVQTAQVAAPSSGQLMARLPELAGLLLLTDEQRLAYDQLVAVRAPALAPAELDGPLPPPPPMMVIGQPCPPPLMLYTPRPPSLGGLLPGDFAALRQGPGTIGIVSGPPDDACRRRLFGVEVEIGDNLFVRGQVHEARRHFELALSLHPGHRELSIRLERCRREPPRPVLVEPASPVVIVSPQPAPVVVAPVPSRPKIAVLSFPVNADPALVPPGFGDWAAQQVASYFTPAYEVVDRGMLFWYMGRLNLSVRDVLTNADARRWLGRALNVRFFVFGVVQQTASFTVSTHLVDAESGAQQGGGSVHVQDHQEFKLRAAELAGQTVSPGASNTLARGAQESERQVSTARRLLQGGKYAEAARTSRAALRADPGNVALRSLAREAEEKAGQAALAATRQKEVEARQADLAAALRRSQELARQAEAARARAANQAVTDQAARLAARGRAHDELVGRAQDASRRGEFRQAAALMESAVALQDDDAGRKGLAEARAHVEQQARNQMAREEQARREREASHLHEAAVAARAKVEDEQRRSQAEEQARRGAQAERDRLQQARLVTQARQLLAQNRAPEAITVLGSAQAVGKTDEIDRLLVDARARQAAALRPSPTSVVSAQLAAPAPTVPTAEAKLADARALAYRQALERASKAMAEKRYDDAIRSYEEAQKFQRSDAVVTGIRLAEEARRQASVSMTSPPSSAALTPRQLDARRLLETGRVRLSTRDLDGAVRDLRSAIELDPHDPAILAALREAEQARAGQAHTTPAPAIDRRQQEYARMMAVGRKALEASKPDEALTAFTKAAALCPADNSAALGAREARQALAAKTATMPSAPSRPVPSPARPPQGRPDYDRQMRAGMALEAQQKYSEAATAYRGALGFVPGDVMATARLRAVEFTGHMALAHRAFAAKQYPQAAVEAEAALKLFPDNPAAKDLLRRAREQKQ